MFDLATIAQVVHASMVGGNIEIKRICTDSRVLQAGDLFVALQGEKFDGQDYADAALASGAAAVMVCDIERVRSRDARVLMVSNTRQALALFAQWWRSRFDIPVVAITGSNGKTTVKEMIASCLRMAYGEAAVLATRGNLNNEIGVPLTLLELTSQHRYAVIEMGMNHSGEIAALARMTQPTLALITNAGVAHLGELGSREAIAKAKGELFEALSPGAVAIINADDSYASYWRGLIVGKKVIDFGVHTEAAVSAHYELADSGSLLTVRSPHSVFLAMMGVAGVHNVSNALAAIAVCLALRLKPSAIAAGLSAYRGVKGRLQHTRLATGSELIDDTYNANPDSMRAAISVLASATGQKILVLGDMGELGAEGPALHQGIGNFARDAGIDRMLAIGELAQHAVKAFGRGAQHFKRIEELLPEVKACAVSGATVLVKGSRFMRMERVVEHISREHVDRNVKTAGGEH
jgi:UDP-N-acetylmuramoyl-tripeptide--D-alanyl-D-alanine ligase